MKYIKSYHTFDMTFTLEKGLGTKRPRTITLPRMTFKPSQIAAGARNIASISEEDMVLLGKSVIFSNLLGKGKKGGYVILEAIPDYQKTPSERIAELEERLASLVPPTTDILPDTTATESSDEEKKQGDEKDEEKAPAKRGRPKAANKDKA